MKRMWVVFGMTAALLAGCGPAADDATAPRPQQAGRPMDPVTTTGRMAAIEGAAVLGDREASREQIEALTRDYMQAIKLADTTRVVDHEAARRAARQVDGVRSLAWIDRENLLVIVSSNEARSYGTIDAICLALEPLGDTLGVVVHLQSGAAVDADDLGILSRNCQLAPGERALLQTARAVDVVPAEVQAQHRADNPRAALDRRERERRNRDAMRIIEQSTPEM